MDLLVKTFEKFLGPNRGHNEYNGQMQFDCPECSNEAGKPDGDGKGNLEISYVKGFYSCWVCRENNSSMRGRIPKLIHLFGNNDIMAEYNLLKPDDLPDDNRSVEVMGLPDGFKEVFKHPNDTKQGEILHYLRTRGITDDIITRYRLGYTRFGRLKNRVIIPSYLTKGRIDYYAARTIYPYIKPKYLNASAPKEAVIFNESTINWDSTIYLVEGPADHIVLYNSIPLLGKELYPHLITTLMTKATGYIVIVMDGEAYKTAELMYKTLSIGPLKGRIKIVRLEDDLDPSKLNELHGRKGLLRAIKGAKSKLDDNSY